MNAIVLEHVKVTELPDAWRAKLAHIPSTTVTVRIEAEAQSQGQIAALDSDDLLFGMWRDREDMRDVADYVRTLRASRFNHDDPGHQD